jgi:hypothetical protein
MPDVRFCPDQSTSQTNEERPFRGKVADGLATESPFMVKSTLTISVSSAAVRVTTSTSFTAPAATVTVHACDPVGIPEPKKKA